MFTAWPKTRTPARITAGEREMINSLLDFHRETALAKCEGLSEDQLKTASVPNSPHSLLGLLRHLTHVELFWGYEVAAGIPDTEIPYNYGMEDNDADFFEVDSHSVDDQLRFFQEAVEGSRKYLLAIDFDSLVFSSAYGKEVSGRFIHLHLLEEYARHCGHIDMIREALD